MSFKRNLALTFLLVAQVYSSEYSVSSASDLYDCLTSSSDYSCVLKSEIDLDSDIPVVGKKTLIGTYTVVSNGYIIRIDTGVSFTVRNVVFHGEESSTVISNAGLCTITKATFEDYTSDSAGGAIKNTGKLTLIDSIFTLNTAALGGAIFNSGSLVIDSCTFDSNTATKSGGAIYSSTHFSVFQTGFYSNVASESGGAVYINGNYILYLSGGNTFKSNSAGYYGGAIYGYKVVDVDGGSDQEFTSNSALAGGAIYSSYVSLINSVITFSENSATSLLSDKIGGGAVYVSAIGTFKSLDFTTNTATNFAGGAIYSTGKLVTISCTFTTNSATYGGAVYHYGTTYRSTDDSFESNSATDSGGAMWLSSSSSTITVVDGDFTSNTAVYRGGAIVSTDSALFIEESTFTSNEQTESGELYGGAGVHISGSYVSYLYSSNVFEDNTAAGYGGGVFVLSGTTHIGSTTTWTDNVATLSSDYDDYYCYSSAKCTTHSDFMIVIPSSVEITDSETWSDEEVDMALSSIVGAQYSVETTSRSGSTYTFNIRIMTDDAKNAFANVVDSISNPATNSLKIEFKNLVVPEDYKVEKFNTIIAEGEVTPVSFAVEQSSSDSSLMIVGFVFAAGLMMSALYKRRTQVVVSPSKI